MGETDVGDTEDVRLGDVDVDTSAGGDTGLRFGDVKGCAMAGRRFGDRAKESVRLGLRDGAERDR